MIECWNGETTSQLQDGFQCTDWQTLYDPISKIDSNVDVLTSYIAFCTDMIFPSKIVTTFPNKAWLKKNLNRYLIKRNGSSQATVPK